METYIYLTRQASDVVVDAKRITFQRRISASSISTGIVALFSGVRSTSSEKTRPGPRPGNKRPASLTAKLRIYARGLAARINQPRDNPVTIGSP
jgi:hypothetical protein